MIRPCNSRPLSPEILLYQAFGLGLGKCLSDWPRKLQRLPSKVTAGSSLRSLSHFVYPVSAITGIAVSESNPKAFGPKCLPFWSFRPFDSGVKTDPSRRRHPATRSGFPPESVPRILSSHASSEQRSRAGNLHRQLRIVTKDQHVIMPQDIL